MTHQGNCKTIQFYHRKRVTSKIESLERNPILMILLRYSLRGYIAINERGNNLFFRLYSHIYILMVVIKKPVSMQRSNFSFALPCVPFIGSALFLQSNCTLYSILDIISSLQSASIMNHLFLLSAWLNLNNVCKPTVSTTVLKIEDGLLSPGSCNTV